MCSAGNHCACCCCFVVLCLVFQFGFCAPDRPKREIIEDSVQSYLIKFGYLSSSVEGSGGALRTEESLRSGIRDLQQFAGLPVTGHVDKQTVELLQKPRCGVRDRLPGARGRRKRFMLHEGKPWPYTNLTWRSILIAMESSSILWIAISAPLGASSAEENSTAIPSTLRSKYIPNVDTYEARMIFAKALDVWAEHSKLTFTEVDSDGADILIYFHRGDHGDNFPFDGKGQVLAHAFFPGLNRGGDAHFDMDEIWLTKDTDTNGEGTNLFKVAAHEFGHSLGLSHSDVEGALMSPWYQGFQSTEDYQLPEDDRLAIQALYGSNLEREWGRIPTYRPTTTTTTTTTTHPPRTRPPQVPYYPYDRYNPHYPPHTPHNPHRPHPEKPPQKPYYPPHYPRKQPMHPDKKHHPKYPEKPYIPKDKYPTRNYPPTKAPEYYPERRYPDWKAPDRDDRYPHRRPEVTTTRAPVRVYPEERPKKKAPDTCDTSFDAVAVIRREVFFFKDTYFWRIGDNGLLPGYPAQISRMWDFTRYVRNFTHVDAVYERPDNNIVFFIGKQFFVYRANQLEPGYPRPLTDLGLPSTMEKIDGATVWGHNGRTFIFSGSQYWRFDEDLMRVELDYPRNMNMWKGVGSNIDAVFQWKDGRTYFFKGKGFWKFNDLHMRVEDEEQTPSGPFWMGCTRNFQTYESSKERFVSDKASGSSVARRLSLPIITILSIILKLCTRIT